MLTDAITKIDIQVLNWIQEHLRCEPLDKLFPIITAFGNKGWFFIVIAIILVCIPKYRKWGAYIGTSLGVGFLFGNILIKNIIARTRPYELVDNITLLVDELSDYSFPSGHTLASFEFFAAVCMLPVKKIYKVLAGILAFAIAFSRLYLYMHFPSDVLAGMLLGTLFGVMGVRIVDMIVEERKNRE